MRIQDHRRKQSAASLPHRVITAGRTMLSQTIARVTEATLPWETVTRMRTERGWKQWVDSLTPELFDDLADVPTETKRQLFKKYVRLVEIETHAKCNRICSFCPNVIVDRRRNKTLMEASVLDRVFDELGLIDYRRQIKVARYSEPLANEEYLLERLASARSRVPSAQLAIVTNTDYLKPETLKHLRDAGLNNLFMSIYLKPSERWSLELAHAYNDRLAIKLGIRITSKREAKFSLHCEFEYQGLEIRSACMNFDTYGTDRGAIMEQYTNQRRLGPCREPFETFVIDYNGSVMPCCNLRSDIPEHKRTVVGDLSTSGTSIFDIYAGRLAAWRRSMAGFDTKAFPCTTCRHKDIPGELTASLAKRMEKHLNAMGRGEFYTPPVDTDVIPLIVQQ